MNIRPILLLFASILAISTCPLYAQQDKQDSESNNSEEKKQSEQPKQRSDGQIATKKVATQAARIGIGTAVGGAAGKVITGSPAGAAAGVILTPSEIGCGEGETCANNRKKKD